MASERCVCPCHTHSGTYPPPCSYCGHDTREGRWVGGYRGWWEPNNDPRDEQIARLTAQLAERDAEIARLVELGERMRLSAMYYAANYAANGGDVLCIEFHAACEAWRAALAARGD